LRFSIGANLGCYFAELLPAGRLDNNDNSAASISRIHRSFPSEPCSQNRTARGSFQLEESAKIVTIEMRLHPRIWPFVEPYRKHIAFLVGFRFPV